MDDYRIDWVGAFHQGVAIVKSDELYGVMLTLQRRRPSNLIVNYTKIC